MSALPSASNTPASSATSATSATSAAEPDGTRFDFTLVVNYYTPYVSGLTETVREVAEGLAARGRRVAVVAARHDPSLPRHEVRNGVEVFRAPVVTRVDRGPVSPAFPLLAGRIGRASSVVNLHTPMLEAGLISRLCGEARVVTTYHIDLWLKPSLIGSIAERAVDAAARSAMRRSAAVVVNSDDQARYSRLWPTMRQGAVHSIPAPCQDRRGGEPVYRETGGLHVGFAGRIAPEKGLEYLVRSFRRIDDPDARLLLAGDYENVAGGSSVESVRAAVGDDTRVRLLGLLSGREIDDFYASIDVFTLPSIAESFGIAQAEAMMTGVPSLTTDIPGGRFPVTSTGFGTLVRPRDTDAITAGIEELSRMTPERRAEGAADAHARFSLDACLDAYEELFDSVTGDAGGAAGPQGARLVGSGVTHRD